MATSYKKRLSVVTEVVTTPAPTGHVLDQRNIIHSGEELSGALAKVAAANTTSVALGEDSFHSWVEVTIGDASTDITFPAPFDGKIVDAYAVKTLGTGGAGDTVVVSLGGTTIVSFDLNTVAANVRASPTIDIGNAANAFVAGATVTVNPTQNTHVGCRLFIGLKRTA